MSRIRETFVHLKRSRRGGFIPFIMAGDPNLVTTELLLVELAAAGADIIELGVPFSDPVADGKVIQRASERALRKGVTVSDALRCISNARQHVDVPIVLFSYLNPILKFGKDRLVNEAKQAGVDAVLVTDLIPEEAGGWFETFRNDGMDTHRRWVRHLNGRTSSRGLAFRGCRGHRQRHCKPDRKAD